MSGSKVSFTRTVKVFVSGTFDRHFYGKNGCATHFAFKLSVIIDTTFNFNGDFDEQDYGDFERQVFLYCLPNKYM